MKAGFAFFILSLPLVFPAQAQEAQQLQHIQEQLQDDQAKKEELSKRAKELSDNYETLRAFLIEAVSEVQENELRLLTMDRRLMDIEKSLEEKEKALQARRKDLAFLTRSLLRLASAPDIALLFQPKGQDDVAEASHFIAGASHSLSHQAERLKEELSEIVLLKESADIERSSILEEKAILAQNQQRLAELMEQNKAARFFNNAEEAEINKRMQNLAKGAANLEELIEGSHKGQRDIPQAEPSAIRSLTEEGRGYLWPAKGEIISHFRESSAYFGQSDGLVLSTLSGAEIVSPFDGKIVFAGPFRSFGEILIIEHRGGYHTILAGLDRIDAVNGQWVLAGEPIGAMIQNRPNVDTPKLYIELRQGDHIIDPAKWLH